MSWTGGETRVAVVDFGEHGEALFSRHCPTCGCFLASQSIVATINGLGEFVQATARCNRCKADVEPGFLGFY